MYILKSFMKRLKYIKGKSNQTSTNFLALEPDKSDLELCERLVRAWKKANKNESSDGDGLWKLIADAYHRDFINLMREERYAEMAVVLSNMFKTPILNGLCEGDIRWKEAKFNANDRINQINICIINLGIALGVYPFYNPENNQSFPSQSVVPEILRRLSELFGHDLCPPQVGGLFGIEYNGKVLNYHNLLYLYAAYKLKNIAPQKYDSCIEIGGGCGMLAYNALKYNSVNDYCIIDLPMVNVIQGYLLLKSEFADCVELYGESDINEKAKGRRLRILPDSSFAQLPDKSYDIAFNQDSLPEMKNETMDKYLAELPRIAKKYFLSINHEGCSIHDEFKHGWVHQAIKKHPAFHQLTRSPYWLRDGYVEELFKLNS